MLQRVGLNSQQEQLYRALIHNPQLSLGEVATRLGRGIHELEGDLLVLSEAGLVAQGADDEHFTITDPEAAISLLVRREQEELDRVKMVAARLSQQLRSARQLQDIGSLVEVITGADVIDERFERGQRNARTRVRVTDRPPYYSGAKVEGMDTQRELMSKGLHYQCLYHQSIFSDPHHIRRTFLAVNEGEEARVLADVPIKLVIFDDDMAMLVLLTSGTEHEPAVIIVHPCALLDSLIALFEALWSRGLPIKPDQPIEGEPEIPHQLLSLLGAGLKDEAIAVEMNVTVRTVRRRISDLYEQLGVHNRFQAGVAAKERGWL